MADKDNAYHNDTSAQAPVVVGLGCRLPGARGPDAMWQVLRDGRCTIGTIDPTLFDPAQYYDPRPTRQGKTYSISAGQIDNLYQFDAGFFGISPREAAQMDPQQRLMLQTTWDAVENAGLNIADLAGDRTGVFVGASIVENLSTYYFDTSRGGSSFSLGNALNVIANRVSATFDFGGPSYVVDAACSSGLYALHQATEALRRGELDTAIVGAVHVIRTPGGYVGFSQARMMSPTGLCRAFASSADGYVRSEACVVLVLQRPDAADRLMVRPRLRLLATGANTDGAASPITVPSAPRQEKLIDRVVEISGRDPEDFAFYEAHGTGTQVGDPVEATSIGEAVAKLRRAPLLIGSAKTNFGHPEPAAGLVGIAKTMLAMEHRLLPASLHFDSPNPNIDFDGLNLSVNATLTQLPETGALVAGVNSFGFGGTNVSAIVEGVTSHPTPQSWPGATIAAPKDPWLLLTAASDASLQRLASAWQDRLKDCDASEHSALAAAVASKRTHLARRLAVPLGANTPAALDHFANTSAPDPHSIYGTAPLTAPRTVFAFAGNGAQYAGMGLAQYANDPEFRHAFDDVAETFKAQGIADVVGTLHMPDLEDQLRDPIVAQPLLFACQIAQTRSLNAAGLHPDAVVGHSIGEIAALHVAGAFDLASAVRIITSRSRALADLRGLGGMAAIAGSEADISRAISGLNAPDLGIAAVNSPRSVTVAGSKASIARLRQVTVGGKRLAMVHLDVEVPYHSPAIEPLRDRFLADLKGLDFKQPTLPIAAAAAGRMMRPRECNADYLWRNVRNTVRFSDALTALADDGPCQIVEISPKMTFAANVRDLARFSGLPVDHFSPLPETTSKTASETATEPAQHIAVRAWTQGLRLDLSGLTGQLSGPAPELPTYPWDEQRHFLPLSLDGLDAWGETSARRLVGRRTERAVPVWMAEFSPVFPTWVADHKVGGRAVLPAAVLVEMALDAGAEIWPDTMLDLRNFDIVAPAIVLDDGIRIKTTLDPTTGAITLSQRPRLTDVDWSPLARGTLRTGTDTTVKKASPKQPPEGESEDFYTFLAESGLEYGPSFRRMTAHHMSSHKSVWVQLAPASVDGPFVLDPMATDAGFHGLAVLLKQLHANVDTAKKPTKQTDLARALDGGNMLLPVRVGRLQVIQAQTPPVSARIDLHRLRSRSAVLDMVLFNAENSPIAVLKDVEFSLARVSSDRVIAPSRTRLRRVDMRLPLAPVKLPRGWSKPDKVLRTLGFTDTQSPGPASIAVETLQASLSQEKAVGELALAELMRLAPNLTDEARAMMAAARGQPARDVAMHSFSQRQLWAVADQLIRSLADGWRNGERLNVLLTGLPDIATLRRLSTDPGLDHLAISHPSEDGFGFLKQVLPTDLMPLLTQDPKPSEFDLVIALGDAATDPEPTNALAPGGLAVLLDTPCLFAPSAEQSEQDWSTWYHNTQHLPVRLRICRASNGLPGPIPAQPKLTLVAPINGDLPPAGVGLLDCIVDDDSTADQQLLVHVHQKDDDPAQSLASLLMSLKQHMQDLSGSFVLVCLQQSKDPGFDILSAGLAAAMRTLRNEFPDCQATLVSVCALPGDQDAATWSAILALAAQETVLHVDDLGIQAERLQTVAPPKLTSRAAKLDVAEPSRLETLNWVQSDRKRPSAGMVEITVAATGLNFRDVMWARGLLPERILENGASGAGFGMECAGTIARVGKGTSLAPGTTVMGFAPSAFGTSVVVPESAVMPVPKGLDLGAAAAVPVVFTTAWEALVRLARVQKGETVLIHGAAGGVGLAAIQIARLSGARVFATAGTPEKRAIARAMGAQHVFDSRGLGFGDALRAQTQGRGVDIVLNSLSGEAMQRSVECLAPFGRFVELGKRDFVEGTRMDLRPFASNLSYYSYDLDQRLAADPEGVAHAMQAISAAFDTGDLSPLPVTHFPADMTRDAFQHMLAARHVGKIVIHPPNLDRPRKALPIRDDWVILGGTGGVGLAVAQALRNKGAARVHLVSRTGELQPSSGAAGRWATADPNVIMHAVDAADPAALTMFFDSLQTDERRVGGVIHAAMTLRDRLVTNLDAIETEQVIRSKLGVAQALDKVMRSRAEQPDHVVFFSSIAARLGNPGQIAYGAANAAMEALVAQRRQDKLPGTAIAWGAIRDRGYLTRNAALSAQLSKQDGLDFLSIDEMLTELFRAMGQPMSQDFCYAAINWPSLAPVLPALSGADFAGVVPYGAAHVRPASDMIELLRTLDWPIALRRIDTEVRDIISNIMRLPAEQFDPQRPFGQYGIDSLMAMELRLELERRFTSALSAVSLSETMTAAQLSATLLARIKDDDAPHNGSDT